MLPAHHPKLSVPETFWQCRVSHTTKDKRYPVNYDSTIIFPIKELAEKYADIFVDQLKTLDLLNDKITYEVKVISLATYVPVVDVPKEFWREESK